MGLTRIAHSFTDSGSPLVNIGLLDICGTLLERDIGNLSTNPDVTSDNSQSLTRSEHIEQSGLSRSTCTHKSSKSSGLDETFDIVQELTGSTWNLDSVVESIKQMSS